MSKDTHKTEKMQPSVTLFRSVACVNNSLVLMEIPLFYRLVDPDDVLPYDATSSNIQMTVAW